MKVSGFSFIRNGCKYDYPIVEAITSILPLCDEFVVAVGNSEDDTLNLIKSIPTDKIRIIETVWDDSLREGGRVLAVETDKAFDAVAADSDWAFYIQGDEVMHEKYIDTVREAMLRYKDDPEVEGLLFNYTHFYGSYDYVGDSRRWYRKEIRVIRNNKAIRSYRDAQGFRKNNEKLRVKPIDAAIYHYGWVKHPKYQAAKLQHSARFWNSDEKLGNGGHTIDEFDYSQIDSLARFKGDHPKMMQARINAKNWQFNFDPTRAKPLPFRYKLSNFVEKITGKRLGEYKNYRVI